MGTDLVVSHDVQKSNNVWTASEILQDFDLALYFLLFHRLEHFDDTLLVVNHIDAFEDFGVFPSACKISQWLC